MRPEARNVKRNDEEVDCSRLVSYVTLLRDCTLFALLFDFTNLVSSFVFEVVSEPSRDFSRTSLKGRIRSPGLAIPSLARTSGSTPCSLAVNLRTTSASTRLRTSCATQRASGYAQAARPSVLGRLDEEAASPG
jgi:hypothetical protein